MASRRPGGLRKTGVSYTLLAHRTTCLRSALFVCLGAPKQEKFMAENMDELHATLLCGLGGSLDIFAGVAKRAPDIFIKLGLEWFYRLLKQPSRIGRMMKLPKFLLIVIRERLFGGKGTKKK